MKDSKAPKTLSTEEETALSILDSILDFCKTNGYRPKDDSLSGMLFASIYKYVHKDPYEHYELWDKIYQIKQFPTYEKRPSKEAAETLKHRKADANAVGIERVFPRAKLVRAIFGEQEYLRMMTQKNNELAIKMFAEYLDDVLFETASDLYGAFDAVNRAIVLLELGAGIGITQEMKDVIKQPTRLLKLSIESGWMPDGIHPRDISLLSDILGKNYDLSETSVRDIHRPQIRKLRANEKLRTFFEHALNGNIDAMKTMLPPKKQQMYEFQQKHKISDVPTDELNAAGKWLADNMTFGR